MTKVQAKIAKSPNGISLKIQDYQTLTKFRLSMMVVFSAAMGYILAAPILMWAELLKLCFGGFLLSGAASAFNQILEREYDRLMDRTSNRPLAAGRMEVSEAVFAAGLMSLGGLAILATFNSLTALIGAISLLSYAFVYTPMKRTSSLAVLVGAFPGAFPPLIGWVAVTGTLSPEALALFGIQFMWQFPHFWAIAWVSFEDYAKAGFYLLPSKGGRDRNTAFQCLFYALLLIPVSLFLFVMGITGLISAVIVGLAGVIFAGLAFNLYIKLDRKSALMLMFGSFIYLPVALIALVIDKV